MIFDDKFDRSLWIMMNGDETNREKLTYFIKIIPKEIYDYIREQIKMNYSYAVMGCTQGVVFQKKIFNMEDEFTYEVSLGIIYGELKINIFRSRDERLRIFGFEYGQTRFEERFRLSLMVLTEDDLSQAINVVDLHVGSFSYDIRKVNSVKHTTTMSQSFDKEYELSGTSSRPLLCSRDNMSRCMPTISNGDCVKKYPSEIWVTDFTNQEVMKKYVRTRKNKRGSRLRTSK